MPQMLHIRLLGDFVVFDAEGVPVTTVGSSRLQALLAYLLLHPDAPQTRDQIAFTLWPDSTEAHARLSLRQLTHLLRRALPGIDRLLHSDSETMQWRVGGPYTLDVERFQSMVRQAAEAERAGDAGAAVKLLQEAAALYKGDLLPGFFDEWVLAEREPLRRSFLGVLQRLVLLLESQADHAAAIGYAQQLVEADPLSEEGYRLVMRLYAAEGDRSAALRAYRRCKAALRDELGVEPSPQTQILYKRLLSEASPAAPTNNLPAQTTMFIGRENELAALSDLLRRPDARLVTLVGVAGIGKTRLALQVATRAVDWFAHGVAFVSLAAITDPGLVISAIGETLALREAAGRPLIRSISDYLRDRRLLLLLDNFEHVATAAPALAQLLAGCPGLKLLVTSRVLLHLYGEREFAVPPLQLPDTAHLPPLEELARCESVALFIDRVQMARPDFTLTPGNAGPIAEICRRLEGLPLAVELAASRTKLLSPPALLTRLETRLDVLGGGALDLPPRQQTLRGAIAWSYRLLAPAEQIIFRRLAVFAGGCTFEAAEAVCQAAVADAAPAPAPAPSAPGQDAASPQPAPPITPLDQVGSLVDKSLLRREMTAWDEPRFYMLESIREYALELLAQSGELDRAQARHAEHYISFAEAAEPHLTGARPDEWLAKLEVEHSNLRRALDYLIGAGLAERALRLAGALRWFWEVRGDLREGRLYLDRALALPADAPLRLQASYLVRRALALNAAGALAYELPDYAAARQYHEESLALRRALGDLPGIASSLNNLGTVAKREEDYPRAEALLQESIARCREIGDLRVMSIALTNLGEVALYQADYERARALFEEALALCRRLGIARSTANVLNSIARLPGEMRDYRRAQALGQEALAIYRRLGDQRFVTDALVTLAEVAVRQGEMAQAAALYKESLAISREHDFREIIPARVVARLAAIIRAERPRTAARLLGAAEAHLGSLDHDPEELYRGGDDRDVAAARPQPGDDYWADLEEGRALSLEEALAAALV